MPDYGHDLLFGTVLVPTSGHPDDAVALARIADRAGLDLVSVPDHPYRPDLLDAWTVLAVIAASTTRVRVFPNVANLPLRPPVMLARAAAGLDLISGGRVELGLGAGAYWDAIAADGGPRRDPGTARRATREAIDVIRALWSNAARTVRVPGEHYALDGAVPGPAPAHSIGIWLGAVGPRMLALTGEKADGWLPSVPHVPPGRLAAGHRAVDEAAASAGRAPDKVRRLYNLSPGPGGFPQGPPSTWPEQLAALTLEHGTSAFLLPTQQPSLIEAFANEVAPATRDLVTAERKRAADRPGSAGRAHTVEDSTVPATPPARATTATLAPNRPGGRLSVQPTPPPTTRQSAERLWDESSRPTAPPADPQRGYSRREQEPARNLVAAHDQLRADLDRLGEVVRQVLDDALDPGEARSEIQRLSLRQNAWTLGAYCASYCRVTTVHHTREDEDLFPHLRRSDPRLGAVLDRLTEEHHAIQGVIERLDRALVAFVREEGDGEALRAATDLLADTLLSHLAYEERELIEPMARFGTGW
ncbi:LLM class flavin-dependent oxidoreductase [Streptomyces acidiscabies]|uniref:LLM class flavin-dependent oxidoreductase n=3 Tax=Streptomyces acidiscabies TaxID=42234 RepID=A0AAP6EJF6_9ACTN|nr:LLM class flavin-dependent oxidoreductase [Streptomyces acidiscabies]MBZ3913848.1 LLM class flavin-dependent oxidoreductase [Streptomyces acidiscabies]MDX2964475.1 LLM class flavin-dependent oxidoreductase [Streptomyces acidiscabies]MDX3022061.1 LLM class flavin-dependent oxidoreductase [Streptomyces acidiscabies]MDX3793625.1 LLM class flavin-dependent oxidoreductase [Streptomyces acidiscabies]GAV37608.1 phthiodiolone/phenolphthiodiolone dimycocerosates ketoreductase [Streptomyces acidiscab